MSDSPTTFWDQPGPIVALAPMAGVTDSPFRRMCKRYGAPLVFSEFVSVKGLHYAWDRCAELLEYTPEEYPLVIQIFGDDPVFMADAAERIEKAYHPAGVDINCGCPAKKIMRTGAGVALMQHPNVVRDIILAVSERITVPLSLKTRAGFGAYNAYDFVQQLPLEKLSGLTIHGRTFEKKFSGAIDVELIAAIKRDVSCKVLANGGIGSLAEMERVLAATGADGVMVGNAALGKPWIFRELAEGAAYEPSSAERRAVILDHATLMAEQKGEHRGLLDFRKHLLWYTASFPGARQLRREIAGVSSLEELRVALDRLFVDSSIAAEAMTLSGTFVAPAATHSNLGVAPSAAQPVLAATPQIAPHGSLLPQATVSSPTA